MLIDIFKAMLSQLSLSQPSKFLICFASGAIAPGSDASRCTRSHVKGPRGKAECRGAAENDEEH